MCHAEKAMLTMQHNELKRLCVILGEAYKQVAGYAGSPKDASMADELIKAGKEPNRL